MPQSPPRKPERKLIVTAKSLAEIEIDSKPVHVSRRQAVEAAAAGAAAGAVAAASSWSRTTFFPLHISSVTFVALETLVASLRGPMLPSCAGGRCTRVQGGASGDVGARAEHNVCVKRKRV